MFAKFKSSPDCNLLLASQIVVRTSINLTEATRAIYFSRDYNFVSNSQSVKRLHRIGSKESVLIHPLIFRHTLEVLQDEDLDGKDTLNRVIFSKDSLSREEWKKVFTGENLGLY